MKKIFFLLIFLLIPGISFAADIVSAGDIVTAENYYRQGKESLNKGDYIHANEYFKRAEKLLGGQDYIVPIPPVQALPVAAARPSVPSFDEASTVPAEVIVKDTRADMAAMAKEAYSEGDYQRAVSLYWQLVGAHPRDCGLLYNLALTNIALQEYSTAARVLEDLLKISPKDLDAIYNLGIIYESYLGEPEKAIIWYKKYLLYAGDNPEAKNVKGWVSYLEQQVH